MKIKTTFFEKKRIKPAIRNITMGLCLSAGLFVHSQTPVAYYPFNGDANDAVGSNNGTVNGATLTTDRIGNVNSAYSFDGVDDFVTLNRTSLPAGLTYGAWIKTNSNAIHSTTYDGNPGITIVGDHDNGIVNTFGISSGKLEYNQFVTSWLHLNGNINVNDDLWHYVVATHNTSGVVSLYVDGVIDVTANLGYDANHFDRIGGSYKDAIGTDNVFNGKIDQVKIYDAALTAAQVLAEFNSTAGQDYRSFASGNWSSPSTWEVFDGISYLPATNAPSSADGVITIRNEHNVTVNSDVTVDQVVVEVGGTLTQASNLNIFDGSGDDIVVNGTYNFIGGELTGTGLMRVNGSMNWSNGYIGAQVILSQGSVTTKTDAADLCLLYNNGVLTNNGTFNWVSGRIRGFGGVFNNGPTGIINEQADNTFTRETGVNAFNNAGVFTKTAGTGNTTIQVPITNTGTINVNSGTLYFPNSNFTNSGAITIANGKKFHVHGGIFIFNTGTAITGDGIFHLQDAALTLNSPAGTPGIVSNFLFSGSSASNAIIIGTGKLIITGGLEWQVGIIYSNIELAAGSVSQRTTTSDQVGFSNGGVLTNNGTFNWAEGDIRGFGGTFNNGPTGIFNILNNGLFTNENGINAFNNAGVLIKSNSAGTTTFHVPVTNIGIVKGIGALNFTNAFSNNGTIAPGTSPGILTMNGQQPLSANSTLEIEILDGTGAGTGHDQLQRNGDLTLAGTLTVTETGTVPEGTYTIINLTSGNISGNFTSFNLPAFYSVQVNTSDVKLIKMYPRLDLTLFLEGPFNGTTMNVDLNAGGLLPLTQPFNAAPWNYAGTESVASIPNANAVDWVLVEFRDATTAASAAAATRIARQAAFLLSDGSITAMDGSSNMFLNIPITNNLFVVVWHKNHLGVMSASPLTLSDGNYAYDFITGSAQAFGGVNGHKQLVAGKWGMFSGDGDANNTINPADKTAVWTPDAGKNGYLNSDYNRNGQVNNPDKNDYWHPNLNKVCQVP